MLGYIAEKRRNGSILATATYGLTTAGRTALHVAAAYVELPRCDSAIVAGSAFSSTPVAVAFLAVADAHINRAPDQVTGLLLGGGDFLFPAGDYIQTARG